MEGENWKKKARRGGVRLNCKLLAPARAPLLPGEAGQPAAVANPQPLSRPLHLAASPPPPQLPLSSHTRLANACRAPLPPRGALPQVRPGQIELAADEPALVIHLEVRPGTAAIQVCAWQACAVRGGFAQHDG